MKNDRSLLLLHQVRERVRSMGPELAPRGDLIQLQRELDLLKSQYEEDLDLANRLATVGALTVDMAHEFATPLGVVLARAQMIVADDVTVADARLDATEIVLQVKRMAEMCRELLAYMRPNPQPHVALDLAQIVRQLVRLLQRDSRKRKASLLLEETGTISQVRGDPSRLMQVLTNLIVNAAQSMPEGGTVRVSVETKRVKPPLASGLPPAEYVCVHVRDDGTGISAADLPHIFESFFTTKLSGEGTGLGLSVSDRITREHNGWIGVVSGEGKGSTFTVYLPAI